ncbi:MAG: M3 family metallopeptidase [Spirochaetales bacterium]|nr:M3 family metallopeptidase [Spirochaetales bacterium]
MKYRFEDLKYTPTDFVSLKNEVSDLTERAKAAASSEALDDVLKTYDSSFGDVGYNYTLAYIRSSLDSSDEYWQNALQKEGKGIAMLDTSELLKTILDNEFYPALAKKYGPALSDKLQKSIATGSKAQKERAEEENLVTQYQREKAMVRVMYKGEMRSEGEISPLLNDPDRNIRVESKKALLDAFLEKKETLGNMLEKLVVLRDKIAKENGFANYLEYMNVNYSRLGYGEKEMDAFVEDVKKYVVPISSEITEETRKRLNLEEMTSLDMGLMFPDGNAKPAGGSEVLKEAALKMYGDLSPEMKEFFSGMLESGSIDVDFSPNKVSGMGFCTDLKKGMYPFVFGNLDGTEWDVAVFTHEVGHAWQGYIADKNLELTILKEMPLDAVEIPSKTMELFSYPYAEEFFGKDGDKFRFSHFREAVKEIVSYTAVHKLNTWIYTHVGATFDEINTKWREIQEEFYPGISDGEVDEENKKGASLLRNMGVFMFPRYLISYALSEMCAIDLFMVYLKDKNKALESYNALCALGGSKSYPEILAAAGLEPSYKEGRVKEVMEKVKEYLKEN